MNEKIVITLFLVLLMDGDTVRGNLSVETNNLTVVAEYLQGQLEPLSDPLKLVSWMIIREIEERTKLENKITDLQAELDSTRSELNSQQTKKQAGDVVAFSARVSTDLNSLAVRQIVSFHDVITNIGGGYHPETSIFHCPFRGLYEFTVTIVTPWHGDADTELMAGGVSRMGTFTYVRDDAPTSGSNYVLLELQKGDAVYVRIRWPEHSRIRGMLSTFSGRLIYNL